MPLALFVGMNHHRQIRKWSYLVLLSCMMELLHHSATAFVAPAIGTIVSDLCCYYLCQLKQVSTKPLFLIFVANQ
jgi:hypothetical protein